ncbi:hypothetical protein GCM10010176_081330 [Nonomuraea spiralis]|nr:hypothetical protein GCM10010176_081330 [Nonomuraea spiralis]
MPGDGTFGDPSRPPATGTQAGQRVSRHRTPLRVLMAAAAQPRFRVPTLGKACVTHRHNAM